MGKSPAVVTGLIRPDGRLSGRTFHFDVYYESRVFGEE